MRRSSDPTRAQGRAGGAAGAPARPGRGAPEDVAPLRLFAYGTLRRGAPMHGLLEGRTRWLGPASAPGRLVDLGAFPGLVAPAAPGERVQGDLFGFEAADAEALLDALDRYEGAAFRRERATVEGPGGPGPAWLFRYTGDASGRTAIAGGDYLAAGRTR